MSNEPSKAAAVDAKELVAANKRLEARLAALEARLAQAEAAAPRGATMATPGQQADAARRRNVELQKAFAADLDARTAALEAALREGPQRFRVSMARERHMTREVGGIDQMHAQAKYMSFYGITGFSPENAIVVEPLGADLAVVA